MLAGWNLLMMKVYDQGGAWGNIVRFKDPDTDTPIADLEISLSPDGPWTDDQGDLDGDGIGDYCDPEPALSSSVSVSGSGSGSGSGSEG